MGSEQDKSSAEQLYRLAMETEIEEVFGEAEPSYHKQFTPPRALAILQKIVSGDGHITIEDIDYQVTKVELKPIRIRQDHAHDPQVDDGHDHENDEYETQMKIVRDRQTRRKFVSSEFDRQVVAREYHDAFHAYVAETTENNYQPVSMTPKKVNDAGIPVILEIDGVDYVLSDLLSLNDYSQVEEKVNVPAKASVDQWPEEVVIYDPDGIHPRTYVRGDVIFVEEGKIVDLRLQPVPKPPLDAN